MFDISNIFLLFCVALPRGPRCVQAPVTGGDPKDKERKEAETEREEAEGDRKPKAPGQCPSGAEKPGVRGRALAATRRPRGEFRASSVVYARCDLIVLKLF